ncbi:MAG: hypothetical protein ACLQDI_01660 [Syntrophobacteraceae bacterium]
MSVLFTHGGHALYTPELVEEQTHYKLPECPVLWTGPRGGFF